MTTIRPPCALVMAGGTGGHIFPGLAVAEALRARQWQVHWLGGPNAMEAELVPARGFAFEPVEFSGVRGKGLRSLLGLPWRLVRACAQSVAVIRRVQPDVVVGLGGYITFPAGVMAALMRKPLFLHEQNSVAGMANRILARLAQRVFTAFPEALPAGEWVGNPLRSAFLQQPPPAQRFQGREGPLRLVVVGGSLGARALNDVVPQALALIDPAQRPQVLHQSGARQIDALRENYRRAGVEGRLVPFIDDMAQVLADADLVVCRAGASTVTELAAVGAAAVLVPFPHAVDDHQTVNARFLSDARAAWLFPQTELTPERLAGLLREVTREQLAAMASRALTLRREHATDAIVAACQERAKP